MGARVTALAPDPALPQRDALLDPQAASRILGERLLGRRPPARGGRLRQVPHRREPACRVSLRGRRPPAARGRAHLRRQRAGIPPGHVRGRRPASRRARPGGRHGPVGVSERSPPDLARDARRRERGAGRVARAHGDRARRRLRTGAFRERRVPRRGRPRGRVRQAAGRPGGRPRPARARSARGARGRSRPAPPAAARRHRRHRWCSSRCPGAALHSLPDARLPGALRRLGAALARVAHAQPAAGDALRSPGRRPPGHRRGRRGACPAGRRGRGRAAPRPAGRAPGRRHAGRLPARRRQPPQRVPRRRPRSRSSTSRTCPPGRPPPTSGRCWRGCSPRGDDEAARRRAARRLRERRAAARRETLRWHTAASVLARVAVPAVKRVRPPPAAPARADAARGAGRLLA